MARRGVAMITVLLMMVVMLSVLGTLVLMTRQNAFMARHYQQRAQTLCLIEGAVLRAEQELARNPDWDTALKETLGDGVYEIAFSGPQADRSVNNLQQGQAARGPRGDDSVPPHTVDLVIRASAGGVTRRVEVLLGRPIFPDIPYALSASGNIQLVGGVQVRGVQSFEDPQPVKSGLHSHGLGDRALVWTPSAGERAEITGLVSTASSTAGAIDFGSDPTRYSVEGFRKGEVGRPTPTVRIAELVDGKQSAPAPALNPLGTTVLSQPETYASGDLVIQGDLELKDSALYVNGKLTVNGSISGKGSLFVKGETKFLGDSEVATNNQQGVALFSQGSVSLSGFDGTQYLEALAAQDPVAAGYYSQMRSVFTDMKSMLAQPTLGATDLGPYGKLRQMGIALGETNGGYTGAPGNWPNPPGPYQPTGMSLPCERSLTLKLQERVQLLPAGSTRNFLSGKLQKVRDLFCDSHFAGPRQPASQGYQVARWLAGEWVPGVIDEVLCVSGQVPEAEAMKPEMCELLRQFGFDRLGRSYFQGVIYTNGILHASHEVSIVGAVWAEGRGGTTRTINNQVYQPGDVLLEAGTGLTLVKKYVENMSGPTSKLPPVQRTWLEPKT